MSAAFFELVSDWLIDAPVEQVWQALHDAHAWPQWWPYVRTVTPLRAGDAQGLGAVRRFRWGSRLPYGLAFDVEVVELQRPYRMCGRASGELDGEGLWELQPDGRGTRVRYTWRVALTRPWMRFVAPLMGPVFRWNHNGVMRAGAEGLARYLNAPLLAVA
jgi:uncharacterized protein YndB with AHSA1/START domain